MLLEVGDRDRSHLDVDKARGISRVTVSIASLDLNIVLLNCGLLFFRSGDGIAEIE